MAHGITQGRIMKKSKEVRAKLSTPTYPHIDYVEDKPVTWTIQLNRYQRDNLLWALQCIRDGYKPEDGFNTGDWVGEIAFMIAKKDKYPALDATDTPNCHLPYPDSMG
jgi:hypothetical protein